MININELRRSNPRTRCSMTRDDIMRMAREAGISDTNFDFQMVSPEELECFAALVAAAESDALEQARLNSMGASREAALMAKLETAKRAWKISDETVYNLTEKVIPNIRNKLEAAEKDIALKERIIDSIGATLNSVAKERDDVAMQLAQSEQGKRKISEECDALHARIEAMEQQEPVMWVNSSHINSSRINKERGGRGDQHTCSETKTAYHDTPLYALDGAKGE